MSYTFNLDHTLAIADIHDMITIDITPVTQCVTTGADVEINGHLNFTGSYLTPELEEESFSGTIPLDITLPYNGSNPEVRPEVISFDYQVENKKALILNLEIKLLGYNEEDMRSSVMDAWVDPISSEPVYEEAIIEPFDMTVLQEATLPKAKELHIKEDIVADDETVVTNVECDEQDVDELQEEILYSPLVELNEERFEIEEIDFDTPTTSVKEFRDEVMEQPRLTESAAALMDELFAMKRGTAFKEEMQAQDEHPVNTSVNEEHELVNDKGTHFIDSVARGFADGSTTIKMIYINQDSLTLTGVLEQYKAAIEDVWNLDRLANELAAGECVMLRYDRSI